MQIYKVGGYVRDKLLGIPHNDCDYVVVGSTTHEMLQLGYIKVGKHFPVFLHPITHEEYALARREKKSGVGHNGFSVDYTSSVSLQEDLFRRDLTINAIAEDNEGNLIDPFGGIKDIQHKILRHISPAFSDDPLRILRVARFAATLGFTVAPETIILLQQMAISQEGLFISRERSIKELELALAGRFSHNFFKILDITNNLVIFFPSLITITQSEKAPQFYNLMQFASTKWQKYTILAVHLIPGTNNLQQIALNRKTSAYIKHTQYIITTLNVNSSNENLLNILKKSNALRDLNNFQLIINNLQWLYQQINAADTLKILLQLLNLAAIRLHQQAHSSLISPQMNNTEIIQTITKWQLNVIQQLRSSTNS